MKNFGLALLLTAGTALPVNAEWTITQLTDNFFHDGNPQVSGPLVVWEGRPADVKEVFFYDGQGVTQMTYTGPGYASEAPRISGSNIVWRGWDGHDYEVFWHDGNSTTQITDNEYGVSTPRVSGQNVVWTCHDGNDSEVYLFNGSSTTQLTDNRGVDQYAQVSGENVAWERPHGDIDGDIAVMIYDGTDTTQIGTGVPFFSVDVRVSGSNVVWEDIGSEIFMYDGIGVVSVSGPSSAPEHHNPKVSGSTVAWELWDFHDREVAYFDGASIIRLTDNEYEDSHLELSGSNLVWHGSDGNDFEIFFYDGHTITQLTDNDYDDMYPQVDGRMVVWQGHDGNDYEIYAATPEPTTGLLALAGAGLLPFLALGCRCSRRRREPKWTL